MYDRNRKLLLAQGNTLTREMIVSLLHAGTEYVYLGEWNADDVRRYESATPISDYREMAERMAETLQTEVDARLGGVGEREVPPAGEPLEASVDDSVQTERGDERIQEWHETYERGVDLAREVIRGEIEDGRVAERATGVVVKLVDAFVADKSFLANLVNLKSRDDYLYQHSLNVAVLAINVATALQYGKKQIEEIGVAALLQDMGMAMVPEDLVKAPRKLTPVEFLDIQKHAILPLYVIEKMKGLPRAVGFVAYQNHERTNGSGYPRRRERCWIHKYARMVSVADVYDALTSDRPWRKAYHPYRAMEHLIRLAREGYFEAENVRALLHCLSLYPLGSLVRLSSGEIAKVVHSNGHAIDRPVVQILLDSEGAAHSSPRTADLLQEEDLRVEDVVEAAMGLDVDDGF